MSIGRTSRTTTGYRVPSQQPCAVPCVHLSFDRLCRIAVRNKSRRRRRLRSVPRLDRDVGLVDVVVVVDDTNAVRSLRHVHDVPLSIFVRPGPVGSRRPERAGDAGRKVRQRDARRDVVHGPGRRELHTPRRSPRGQKPDDIATGQMVDRGRPGVENGGLGTPGGLDRPQRPSSRRPGRSGLVRGLRCAVSARSVHRLRRRTAGAGALRRTGRTVPACRCRRTAAREGDGHSRDRISHLRTAVPGLPKHCDHARLRLPVAVEPV